LYPFFREQDLDQRILNTLTLTLASIQPFTIVFEEFGFFQHGKKSFTLFLKPSTSEVA